MMRVLVTGASGHIGSALVPELVAAGHEVVGLARSDAAAAAVERFGGQVRRGDLADLDGLTAVASEVDGVVHLAFDHDAMRAGDFVSAAEGEVAAMRALAGGLRPGSALVGTSGTLVVSGLGHPATEDDDDLSSANPRAAAAGVLRGLSENGVRTSLVRLPPIVHSDLDGHGFLPTLIGLARTTGVAGYLGDGRNVWPSVDTRDAAVVYRLALEKAPAGATLHAVADEGVPTKAIAEAIGRHLDVPVRSIPQDEIGHFGFLAFGIGLDNPVSSAQTRELLGWTPSRPGLLADIDAGHYFS